MIVNGNSLLEAAPIVGMSDQKLVGPGGTSFGLGEAGYDIRIKQEIKFMKWETTKAFFTLVTEPGDSWSTNNDGRFCLASAMEEFQMPTNMVGVVHDKSTWARRGLSVFNTVIEPGWNGFLTLELVYHGEGELIIPAGSGIAQVLFSQLAEDRAYTGKYQNQEDKPVSARSSEPKANGLKCSVCGLPQFESPGGDVCEAGHGGAPGL